MELRVACGALPVPRTLKRFELVAGVTADAGQGTAGNKRYGRPWLGRRRRRVDHQASVLSHEIKRVATRIATGVVGGREICPVPRCHGGSMRCRGRIGMTA